MLNRKVVSGLTLFFLIIFLIFAWVFYSSQAKSHQAQQEAVRLIETDYTVKDVKKFYWTTISEAYFALDFVDDSGQERYAIVKREGGTVNYYTPNQIISEEDAKAIALADNENYKIMKPRLGMIKATTFWEITIKNDKNTLTYYYLNAQDGSWLQKIENI